MKKIIATAEAPPALGPYAQAVRNKGVIYVSGQLPLDPKTRQLVGGSIAHQTEQVLVNIRAILEENRRKIASGEKKKSKFSDMLERSMKAAEEAKKQADDAKKQVEAKRAQSKKK